ncbi:uncharacterized protein LOC128355756 [Scomber japonicus]|uniref:uncharacterized protein LOC128355756 n=1 Tax=Scomber japonicus TaxID=13676 RepID=UPI0023061EC8|nr:uncharacterized protein LOC128355756 [Scomber japonicus]
MAYQVMGQNDDIFPARIWAQQKMLSENSDLYLTCSTFGSKKNSSVFLYLCKDGRAIKNMTQKESQNDSTFTINNVGTQHSGNYSCVFSKADHPLSEVAKTGINTLEIIVIANFLPADISMSGPSTVSEGDNVEFRCTVSDILQTFDKCRFIHSYLKKNETVLQVQMFNVTRMEVTFTIGGAVMRDSGHYTCVVLPSKCHQENKSILYGNNSVFLEVKESLVFRVTLLCGFVIHMLLLVGCLCWNKRSWVIKGESNEQHATLCNPCEDSQQANLDVVERLEERTEGQDLEGQYDSIEDSFSTDNEESQNSLAVVDSTYESYEPVYNEAEAEPARAVPVYTMSLKKKRHKISKHTE